MGAGHDHHHVKPHHGHDHSSDHGHQRTAGAAFRWSIALNSGLTALQLAIGFGFGSLALIGDALHNLVGLHT